MFAKFSGSATVVQKMIYPLQPAYFAYTILRRRCLFVETLLKAGSDVNSQLSVVKYKPIAHQCG